MPEAAEGLGEFFDYVWRDTQGYVYLPTIHKGQLFKEYMFEWPRERRAIVKHVVIQNGLGNDVFYSPALYGEPSPLKESVKGTWLFWADFDGSAPESWAALAKEKGIPEPSLTIRSSVKGREHAYWALEHFVSDIEQIDARNRAIAYTLGADTSGWDADQILRPPFTKNYGYGTAGNRKPWYAGDPVDVSIVEQSDSQSSPDLFNPLGTPEQVISTKLELGEIPRIADVLALGRWSPDFYALFSMGKEDAGKSSPDGRSGSLMRLGYYGAESGFSDEQIYAVLDDADSRWEKYTKRTSAYRRKLLLDIIARARAKHGYLTDTENPLAGLIAKAEPGVAPQDQKLVYNFQEFMDLEVHIEWLVEGLLSQTGMGIITGPPGVGKTQLGIQLAHHLALGKEEFLGWRNPSGAKKVLFLSLEMGVVQLKHFMSAIARGYQDVIALSRNLFFAPFGVGIPFDRLEGQALLTSILEEYKPDVVFVDSLQKITSKEMTDELSTKMLMEYLDTVREKYKVAMYMIHHNRKAPADGSREIRLEDMYGSQFIAANVDFVLNLRSQMRGVVTVDSLKVRLAEERPAFDIVRDENLMYHMDLEGLLSNVPDRRGVHVEATQSSSDPGDDPEGKIFSL